MQTNLWCELLGTAPTGRLIKGNVEELNGDGSYNISTSDGSTIRARPQPGQAWDDLDGVFVLNGVIVDSAPDLEGVTQYA